MRITLLGYMASGKSFWGKKLAAELGVDFYDLDSLLERDYLQCSISNFIKKKGELAFRKIEKQALEAFFAQHEAFILACGGGTPCYYNNIDIINKNSFSVFLNPTLTTLVARLLKERIERPLLSHLKQEEVHEFVAKHLFERRAFYAEAKAVVTEKDLNQEYLLNLVRTWN